ncbi:LysR family transcriptional regulator [Mesorhizobium sp. CC13]|uniref:LysR family transcriptional regulator n=1 Tax=Mesorhizobium sp. CC13 TaxID=3029194 RepID=UPI003264C5E0
MVLRNLAKLDLNLLHVFAAVYSEASITRAAETLNVTQPAVSNSLSRLRDVFGDQLFVRAGQGIAPTPLARSLIEPIRGALVALDRTLATHEPFDPLTSERILCFSMSDFAEAVVLAPLIGEINRLGSKVTVRNHFVAERDLYSGLASGEIDFAVESHPLGDPDLGNRLLFSDEFVCVMRRNHPVLSEPFGFERYLGLGHLHISNRPRIANLVDGALARLRCRRHVSVHVEHCLAAGAILAQSDLCLTIPTSFVRHFLPADRFAVVERPFRMPPLQTWLYWHPASESSPSHKWVRQLLEGCFPLKEAALEQDHHG